MLDTCMLLSIYTCYTFFYFTCHHVTCILCLFCILHRHTVHVHEYIASHVLSFSCIIYKHIYNILGVQSQIYWYVEELSTGTKLLSTAEGLSTGMVAFRQTIMYSTLWNFLSTDVFSVIDCSQLTDIYLLSTCVLISYISISLFKRTHPWVPVWR